MGKEEAHAVSIAGAVGMDAWDMDAWEADRQAATKRMIYAAKERDAVEARHDERRGDEDRKMRSGWSAGWQRPHGIRDDPCEMLIYASACDCSTTTSNSVLSARVLARRAGRS